MKKLLTVLSLSFSLSLTKADYWTQKANYPGLGHSRPYFFSINQKGYIGCGDGPTSSDFWEYDQATNSWTARATFAGGNAHSGTSFSIADKGYAGLGWIQNIMSRSFWEYNPASDSWTQVADFPGGKRQVAISFVIGNKAYVGTGYDSIIQTTNDFYEYDPANNAWTQKSNFPGMPRYVGVGFSIGSFGYAGGGVDNSTTSLKDFYKYDPVMDAWSPIAVYPGAASPDMAAFSIGSFGYTGTGQIYPPANTVTNEFWQYDPAINQWNQKTNFQGLSRDETAYFSIDNKGYIGAGGVNGNNYYADFWEYTPDSTTSIEEFPSASVGQFSISPNPAKDYIVINYPPNSYSDEKEKINLVITDAKGKKVLTSVFRPRSSDLRLPVSSFKKGIYFVELITLPTGEGRGGTKAIRKFIKE